jgi:formylmethanofuran dehydrogenase subunit E
MKAEDILAKEDFKKCVDFHGHLCPGLSMGYRASLAGMEWLRARRASDEEIVAVVETDACGADAVQVITGCTFGKGNFIYKDHGKMAFTFLKRRTGEGVRIVLKADSLPADKHHTDLIKKIQTDTATESERAEFKKLHQKRSFDILEKPAENLFNVKEIRIELPTKAKIEPSKPCERCGEPTMESKLSDVAGLLICKNCEGNQ